MKACPKCGRLYPADAAFCPVDGAPLQSATEVPVAPDARDPRVGQLVCQRYQVRRVIADGGMGRVYEALDIDLQNSVALKILHPDVAEDEVQLERFKREFEVSRLLPHEHIVDVRDFQPTEDGSYVLVMELLYGEELRSTLKREGVIRPARLVRMLSQAAIALDRAHERRLVHRDLKPDNLFLCQTSDGDIVKILDFGSVRDNTETAKKLTVMGTTIGSPYYMSPEQAQGLDSLDHRADVWALSAIAYECITSEVPFNGVNGPAILLQILTKEPRPASQVAQGRGRGPLPPGLDRVLASGLKKSPSVRLPSVGALADAVGHAFGLQGDHNQWATTPERSLAETIEAALPSLMVAQANSQPSTVDDFFGESDALGGLAAPSNSPAPAPSPRAEPGPLQRSLPGDDDLAAGIPKSRSPLGMIVALAGLFLFVCVALVFALK